QPPLSVPKQSTFIYDLGNPAVLAEPIAVTSPAPSPVSFTAAAAALTPPGANWLSVDVTSGVTPAVLKLTANPRGLSPGTYLGTVRYTAGPATTSKAGARAAEDPCADHNTTVTLTVSDGTPGLIVNPQEIAFTAAGSDERPSQRVFIGGLFGPGG